MYHSLRGDVLAFSRVPKGLLKNLGLDPKVKCTVRKTKAGIALKKVIE